MTVDTFTLILKYLLNWQHLYHNIRIYLEKKYKYSHSILCLNLNNKLLTEFNNVYLKNVFPFNNTNVKSLFTYHQRPAAISNNIVNDELTCLPCARTFNKKIGHISHVRAHQRQVLLFLFIIHTEVFNSAHKYLSATLNDSLLADNILPSIITT